MFRIGCGEDGVRAVCLREAASKLRQPEEFSLQCLQHGQRLDLHISHRPARNDRTD